MHPIWENGTKLDHSSHIEKFVKNKVYTRQKNFNYQEHLQNK